MNNFKPQHANWWVGSVLAGAIFLPGLSLAQQQSDSDSQDETVFEKVTVTATKRSNDLREIAGSVSALTGEMLSDMGAESLSDYINRLPGVHFNDYQPGVSEVVIRGVSASTYHEQGQTTVGYFINDIPLSEAGWPIVLPDVDTFDLERVEVLRGPQGSLYGAATLGGLVNYIAKEAKTDGFNAAFEGSLGSTKNSGDPNYSVKGMVNLPLIDDVLAARFVVLDRYEGGYLDNIGTGEDHANNIEVKGYRGSVMYTPTEQTKISFMSMYQETDLDDQTYATFPTLTRDTVVPEPHHTEFTLHSLRLEQDLGFADLTFLGAVADKDSLIVFDYSLNGYLQAGVGTWSDGFGEADSDHLELRLSSKGTGSFNWLVGVTRYTSEKRSNDAVYQAGAADYIDANPDLFGGFSGSLLAPNDYFTQYQVAQDNEDSAIFGEISYALTQALELTIGGRYFDTSSETIVTRPPSATFAGVYSSETVSYGGTSAETGFTPKVSLKYSYSEDLMMYASYSEGFRVGGTNPNPPGLTAGAPQSYEPDSTTNMEIGARVDLLDNSLLLDATLFRIDWTDIQVRLFTPAPDYLAYVTNAGEAQIDGVEFSAAWRPINLVEFNTNVTYLDAAISEFLPDTFAVGGGYEEGTTLPGASDWTIANNLVLNLDDLPFAPRVTLSHRYVSEAPVAFRSVTKRGGYNMVDLRADMAITDTTKLAIYVDNVFDEYAILNSPFGDYYPAPLASVTRPRTIGARISWTLY
ncbi:MAG: TonB-dependent receptor [Gammaproteobacteria bacterium]|nr:TonB-dependent receptor [Gammaproteobacteria bacterium]